VALLTVRDFAPWRDALAAAELSPASVNRTNTALKAALNHAADQDERITNRRAWQKGLAALPDAAESRNVVLDETSVRAVISAAYNVSAEFGLLIEVLAVTGARTSQIAQLEVGDVQADRTDPRLMMPGSKKGSGRKTLERRPVPVPTTLANRLAATSKGRASNARLLLKLNGEPWRAADCQRPFAAARSAAGLSEQVTPYALRHSSIVRQLLAGVPVRVVAAGHDSSVKMLEQTYSRYIGDHSDALIRRSLLDTAESARTNVAGRNAIASNEHQDHKSPDEAGSGRTSESSLKPTKNPVTLASVDDATDPDAAQKVLDARKCVEILSGLPRRFIRPRAYQELQRVALTPVAWFAGCAETCAASDTLEVTVKLPPKDKAIRRELSDVITEVKQHGTKPLNINELSATIKSRLLARGLHVTQNDIKTIANEAEFQRERGPVGKRWT
jgi:integrase